MHTCADLQPLETPTDEFRRADDVWFDDGNLILQAEQCLFRIYSGILAARSSVFRDMLTFPPPPEGNRMLDGCPIVEVYDSAQDMIYFLKAILDSSFFEPPPTPTELPVVTAVLRLSTKYDVQFLRKRALLHLATTFPMSLDEWKFRDQKRTIPPLDNTPFAALLIAREFDLVWLLPSIMYCISSHPLIKTLDGAQWNGSNLNLNWEDKRACILGRSSVVLMQGKNALKISSCSSLGTEKCDSDSCGMTRLRCADIMSSWGVAGLLDFYEENSPAILGGFCPTCQNAFKDECQIAGQTMWNALPGMFNLPGWDELDRMRLAALD